MNEGILTIFKTDNCIDFCICKGLYIVAMAIQPIHVSHTKLLATFLKLQNSLF